jgi:hypothetical protein
MKCAIKIIFFFSFALAAIMVKGQGSELGVFLGGSYYLGDLNSNQQFYNTKFAAGGIYRYIINPRYAIKASVIRGTLEAFDHDSPNISQRERNLHFRTTILDFSTQIEFNFFPYRIGDPNKHFSPYIFAGISLFRFNPKAQLDGIWYDLQPLGTEGQNTFTYPNRKAYSLTQPAFPFGMGFKKNIGRNIGVGIEWSLRKTFTDYLDDVSTTHVSTWALNSEKGPVAAALSDRTISENGEPMNREGLQRGNSKRKDWYSFAGIIITYKIGPKLPKCPTYK